MAQVKRINLALQGGGVHGAFTWGVLDALLEEPRIEIAAISGTSAGALNGAAVKVGLSKGSRDLAQETLERLWTQVGAITDVRMAPWFQAFSPQAVSATIESSWPFVWSDTLARLVSPYSSGPFYHNPLEPIVAGLSYDEICGDGGPQLHVCATNVRTGKIRIFTGAEIGPLPLMASACLPTLYRAVEIEDPTTGKTEAFWDGGYTGNPALFPLFGQTLPRDVLIVNINPLVREEIPTSARAIQNRINEISFNSSLLRELRAIEFVQRLIARGHVAEGSMKHVLIHMVGDDALMRQLSVATKTFAVPALIHQLRAAGHAACTTFLSENFDSIGVASSVDLPTMFG